MTKNIQLNLKNKNSIDCFVDMVGDIQIAAKIMGLGTNTLSKYIESGIIPENVWLSKIEPFVKYDRKQIFKKLVDRIKELEKSVREDNKYIQDLHYKEYELKDYLKNSTKKINIVCENKFIAYTRLFNYFEPIENLVFLINSIKSGIEIKKEEVYYSMKIYGMIYELFRPNQITQDHFYWGTVKTMDAIFFNIACQLDFDLKITFSNWGSSILDRISLDIHRENPSPIDWKRLLNDLEWVSKCIKKTICENAFDLFFSIGGNNYIYFEFYIRQYFSLIYEIAENEITINRNEDKSILIKGYSINIENLKKWELESKFRELKDMPSKTIS